MTPDLIRYLRLRNGDELVAYVNELEDSYSLYRPMLLIIVNYFEDGKQMLNFREYLPPSIVNTQTVKLQKQDVVLCIETLDKFREQYVDMCSAFFDEEAPIKKKASRETKEEKVVSLLEALSEKKGKPVH